VLYILSNTIFKININTNDIKIKNIISKSLESNNISIYKRKKSFNEIEKIKEKILDDNEDNLEWIEIREKGCTYNVNVTPRIKKQNNISSDEPSDIVASKDGKILFITSSRGNKIKDKNDYVKKGEVIISGNIMKNDKVAYQVSSKGKVYGEVWYTVNVTVPYNYIEYVDTGKTINHYYLDVFGHKFTLIGKYEGNNTMNYTKLILDKPYLPFKLYKEEKRKYEYKEFNITETEAYEEAIKRSYNKIKNMLDNDEYIISKKILKKEAFSSKIKIEVFYKVYENIGITSKIKNVKEK
jgi:similar to stage IV sporulation protein